MSKRALVVVYLSGLVLSGLFLYHFSNRFPMGEMVFPDVKNGNSLILALMLIILGELIRTMNSGILVNLIAPSTFGDRFRALMIGTLFHLFLPFRLGEFVRAHVLGKMLMCSRTSIFLTIVFERAIDLCILTMALALFLILNSYYFNAVIDPVCYTLLSFMALLLAIMLFAMRSLANEKGYILSFVYKASALFNNDIRDRTRYIMWGSIITAKLIFEKADLKKFAFQAMFMWGCYITSIFYLIKAVYVIPFISAAFLSIASYFSLAIPSGPGFIGSFNFYFSRIVDSLFQSGELLNPAIFSFVVLGFLMIPPNLVGVIYLLVYKKKQYVFDPHDIYLNKLMRHDNIYSDLSHFLDEYFSQNKIFNIISNLEGSERSKVMSIFEGGSNAVTLLMCNYDKTTFVRKIALKQYSDKLIDQYNWLNAYNHSEFPKIISNTCNNSYYYFDLKYYEGYETFYNYIHNNTVEESIKVVNSILEFMNRNVYVQVRKQYSMKLLHEYVAKKAVGKIEDVASINQTLYRLLNYEKIEVNGIRYDNFYIILKKIMDDGRMLDDLANFRECMIHGDLAVDNILVSMDKFILLDPNNENLISGPIVDIAKLYQSFHSGYEFLCKTDEVRVKENAIIFNENISTKYQNLFQYLHNKMKIELNANEYRSLYFHEGIHYCRMLPYKAKLEKETLPMYYAVGVRLLNEFCDQYANGR